MPKGLKNPAIAILNLKSTLPTSTASGSLSYKALKGDQPTKVIQDLDGNDRKTFINIQVEMI